MRKTGGDAPEGCKDITVHIRNSHIRALNALIWLFYIGREYSFLHDAQTGLFSRSGFRLSPPPPHPLNGKEVDGAVRQSSVFSWSATSALMRSAKASMVMVACSPPPC